MFLDHANISSSRYLKPSKLVTHTTIQRIDAQRPASGERRAAKWEQELAEIEKTVAEQATKGAANW